MYCLTHTHTPTGGARCTENSTRNIKSNLGDRRKFPNRGRYGYVITVTARNPEAWRSPDARRIPTTPSVEESMITFVQSLLTLPTTIPAAPCLSHMQHLQTVLAKLPSHLGPRVWSSQASAACNYQPNLFLPPSLPLPLLPQGTNALKLAVIES